jgi:hypothetical protein
MGLLLAGVGLFIIGWLMEHRESRKQAKYWKERWKGYLVDKDGSHYPPGGWDYGDGLDHPPLDRR